MNEAKDKKTAKGKTGRKITGYLFRRKSKSGKPTGPYYVQFRYNKKTTIRSTGETLKREAEKKRDEIVALYQARQAADVQRAMVSKLAVLDSEANQLDAAANPPPQLSRVWDRFEANPTRPDSGSATLDGYRAKWHRFLLWITEAHPEIEHLHQIDGRIVSAYAADLAAAKLSAGSYNQHRQALALIWRIMAAEDETLKINPWEKLARRRNDKQAGKHYSLSDTQYNELLVAAGSEPDMKDLLIILAKTGLRFVDGVKLKWGNVDFQKNIVTVIPRKMARRGGEPCYIGLFPEAVEVLNRRQSGNPLNPRAFVFPEYAAEYDRDRSALSKRIQKAFRRAGMEPVEHVAGREKGVARFGAHSLRHYWITKAQEAGLPAAYIRHVTGHQTNDMVMHYSHFTEQYAAGVAGSLQTGAKALPEANGGATPLKALPEPGSALLGQIRAGLEGMTDDSWERDRDRLLELLPAT